MAKPSFFGSIEQRVLAITLVPLLLITISLGSYFIITQLNAAENALSERGRTLSELLARSAEFGLLVNDKNQLTNLLEYSRDTTDITDIVFLDRDFNVVVRTNKNGPAIPNHTVTPVITENRAFFIEPVVTTGIDFADLPEFGNQNAQPDTIGWVAVVLSRRPTVTLQSELLLKGIFIAGTCFLITLLLAARFGRRISTPVLELTHVVEELEKGHLGTRSRIRTSDEFRTLSRGINRLAETVHKAQRDYHADIDEATRKIRATLAHIEEKNSELDAALTKADEANTAKDEFLARMSHELRTPLTSVIGFARLLDTSELSENQQEYVKIINQASSLLLAIIDDILDYSKLESNAVTLEVISLDIQSLVHDVIDMQAPEAHRKMLEITAIIDPQTPQHILGDPIRLRQILTNLIGNAIKFTHAGHITINLYPSIHDTSELIIRVEDTGIGIAKSRLAHVFGAFSQADHSITRRFGGSGLGLAISKRLTELMGGSFSINSRENQGTQITLTLPLSLSLPLTSTYDSFPKSVGQIVIYDPVGLTRRSLRYQLNSLSPRPYSAAGFSDMLRYVKEHQVDTIIWGISPKSSVAAQAGLLESLRQSFDGRIVWLHCHTEAPPIDENSICLRKPSRTSKLLASLLPSHKASFAKVTSLGNPITSSAKRVLIAEDNSFNQLLLQKILKHSGVLSFSVDNGADAVQKGTSEHFDAVIMDVHMPIMDGIEASQKLHQQKPCLPIIALTANVMPSEHERLRKAGVYQVLTKPIDDTQLRSILAEVLNTDVKAKVSALGEENLLERLDINPSILNEELQTQLNGLKHGFLTRDEQRLRNHNHQLLGIAGLYELPEIEALGYQLRDCIHSGETRAQWRCLWRMQRIIAQSNKETEEH